MYVYSNKESLNDYIELKKQVEELKKQVEELNKYIKELREIITDSISD